MRIIQSCCPKKKKHRQKIFSFFFLSYFLCRDVFFFTHLRNYYFFSPSSRNLGNWVIIILARPNLSVDSTTRYVSEIRLLVRHIAKIALFCAFFAVLRARVNRRSVGADFLVLQKKNRDWWQRKKTGLLGQKLSNFGIFIYLFLFSIHVACVKLLT